jgi:hypothetical protein
MVISSWNFSEVVPSRLIIAILVVLQEEGVYYAKLGLDGVEVESRDTVTGLSL